MWNRGSDEKCADCPEPELLEENEQAMQLFGRCTTQFRHGFDGPTGLDYAGVRCAAKALDIDFKTEFVKIQVMENEFLALCRENRKKETSKNA